MFKKNIFLLLSGGILVLAILAIGANGFIVEAQAVPDNAALSGWAWSSNIGWIKFKSTGTEPVYGVNIVTDTSGPNAGIKRLAGGAWSSSIGWVKFNPTPGPDGYPDDTASKKDAQFSGTNIIGWARACTVFINSDCNGALKDTIYRGGWDGWLKMGGGSLLGGGVRLVGQQLTGFAWGGEVLGWVKFDQVWNGPNGCTGVCIDTNATTVSCTVSNPTPELGENVDFTSIVTGVPGPYSFNWQISGSNYYDQDTNFSPYTITRAFNTPGTKVFSLNVNYGSHTTGIGNATCTATVDVQSENENSLNVVIEGNGTVTSNPTPAPQINTRVSKSYSYKVSDTVSLLATPDAGGSFTWGGDCAGIPSTSRCVLSMGQSRTVNVVFTNVPQFCFDVSYERGPGGEPLNSMRVDSRNISNMDERHESTAAKVEVKPLPGQTVTGVSVPLSLNISLLSNKSTDGTVPKIIYDPSALVEVGSHAFISLEFPTDGNTSSNTISPYAGNYQFLLTATNAGGPIGSCSSNQSPRLNFSYIDFREREQ